MRRTMLVPTILAASLLGAAQAGAQSVHGQPMQPQPAQAQARIDSGTVTWHGVPGRMARPDLTPADLAGLDPVLRAEVDARMAQGGQTRRELIETILLKSLQGPHEARRIVSMNFAQGGVVFDTVNGQTTTARFDRRTLDVLN